MKLLQSFSLFLLVIWCLSGGIAVAGTFLDDFSDGSLGEEWFVTKKRATGEEITEAGGILTFDAQGEDVVVGIRYGTVDLTQGEFVLECDYITGYQQTYISFTSVPSETEAWDTPPMFIFIAVNGTYQFVGGGGPSVDPAFSYAVGQEESHHYRIVFTPTGDNKVYDYYTSVDNDAFEQSGTLNIADMDPTTVYVYFEVWTPSGNPTSLDNVAMTSASIQGTTAVEALDKLPTRWGSIKSEY